MLTSSEEHREFSEAALQALRCSENWLRFMAVYRSTKLIPSQRNHDLGNFGMGLLGSLGLSSAFHFDGDVSHSFVAGITHVENIEMSEAVSFL